MYALSRSGTYGQYLEKGKHGYLEEISDVELRHDMTEKAKKDGFNAIIGYRFDVHGGFNTYQGKVINGSVGLGVYRATAMGVPVLVKCD